MGQINKCNLSERLWKSNWFDVSDIRIGGIRGGEKIGVNVGRPSEGGEEARRRHAGEWFATAPSLTDEDRYLSN